MTPDYSNETFYKNIYRIEPGHFITIENNKIIDNSFWELDPEAPSLLYKNDGDYLAHFNLLLDEAIHSQTKDVARLGAEFSGGLDSSAVLVGCHRLNLAPQLFCHIAPTNGGVMDDVLQARCVVEQLNFKNAHYVDAENFDPIAVFDQLSAVFAGAPCYPFFMLANNVHQAVVNEGCTALLSGFGGDECVSGYARNISFYPELLRKQQYRLAWQEMTVQLQKNSTITPGKIKTFTHLLRYAHPLMFTAFSKISDMRTLLKSYLNTQSVPLVVNQYPYHPSVRYFEYSQLQGRLSRHVRMRVEYSAVLSKQLGFQYLYPLLHPKLVEFCFLLPATQKRRHGIGRNLIRQYLAQYLPALVSEHNNKRGDIMPATRYKYLQYLKQGKLNDAYKDLPFEDNIKKIASPEIQPLAKILAYMFKCYSQAQKIDLP